MFQTPNSVSAELHEVYAGDCKNAQPSNQHISDMRHAKLAQYLMFLRTPCMAAW